eukprot:7112342-Prymnesium_polylepis.1
MDSENGDSSGDSDKATAQRVTGASREAGIQNTERTKEKRTKRSLTTERGGERVHANEGTDSCAVECIGRGATRPPAVRPRIQHIAVGRPPTTPWTCYMDQGRVCGRGAFAVIHALPTSKRS